MDSEGGAEARPGLVVTYVYSYAGEPSGPPELMEIGDEAVEAFGYPLTDWRDDPYWWQRILHPEDFGRAVGATWETTLQGSPYRIEYRVVRSDSTIVWVRDTATVERNEADNSEVWRGSWTLIPAPSA
jgi:diguanylate cyclase